MRTDKNRHTVWLSNEAWNQVNLHYREDNCTFQNEYIEKAIRFYSGYLDAQSVSAYLPRILSDVREVKQINGEIKFEDALKYQKGLD